MIRVVLHRLAQVVAQRGIHHIAGIIGRHPHLAGLGILQDGVLPQIIVHQPPVASLYRLRLTDAPAQHLRPDVFHIGHVRPVNV